MVKVRIIKFGNSHAIVERDGIQYRVPLEEVIFGENPAYGYIHVKQLTAARVIHDD